jgi:D-ribose pyranose/furanose isomerase RbsD
LNLLESFHPLGAGLPVPEHHESLPADAALSFSIAIGTFAENLHSCCLRVRKTLNHEDDFTPGKAGMPIPLKAILAVFCATST